MPVDVELLMERIEGLDLDYWPALRENYGVQEVVLIEQLSVWLCGLHLCRKHDGPTCDQ
jgi:hypothetical protein